MTSKMGTFTYVTIIILLGETIAAPCPSQCTCTGTNADCENTMSSFTSAPMFPNNIRSITFADQLFINITEITLQNLTNLYLTNLTLWSCNTRTIAKFAFGDLRHLEELQLLTNPLTVTGIQNAFYGLSHSPLKTLQLIYLRLPHIPAGFFLHLKETRLATLSLAYNNMTWISRTAFEPLQSLESVDLSGNPLSVPALKNVFYGMRFLCLHSLVLAQIKLVEIPNDLFVNLNGTGVTMIDLSFNRMERISPSAFEPLRQLMYLDLSHNSLTDTDLRNALQGMRFLQVTKIILTRNRILSIPNDMFCELKHSKLSEILLMLNGISTVDLAAFKDLPLLTHLNLAANSISSVKMDYLPGLQDLQLSQNRLNSIPDLCSGNQSFLPALQYLDISWNNIKLMIMLSNTTDCLISLKHIDISGLSIFKLGDNLFANLPALETIYFRHITLLGDISRSAFNNTSIRAIDLSGSGYYFQDRFNIFSGCPFLTHLTLNGNNFLYVTKEESARTFNHLKRLKYLSMEKTQIESIPEGTTYLTELEELLLNSNSIISWTDNPFERLTALKRLELRENKISIVSENAFTYRTRKNLLSVDFSSNPLDCSCQNLWFIQWIKQNTNIFKNVGQYRCASPETLHGKRILDIEISERSCLPEYAAFIVSLVMVSLAVVSLTVASVCYVKRWHIRYYLYKLTHVRRLPIEDVENTTFLFDTYVIYAEDDRDWILKTMLPRLRQDDIRVAAEDVTFNPGSTVMHEIVHSLENSRKIVLVLSNDFCQSNLCLFQLDLAQHFVIENGMEIILISLSEIEPCRMTHSLHALFITYSLLEWNPDENQQEMFWDRLVNTLRQE